MTTKISHLEDEKKELVDLLEMKQNLINQLQKEQKNADEIHLKSLIGNYISNISVSFEKLLRYWDTNSADLNLRYSLIITKIKDLKEFKTKFNNKSQEVKQLKSNYLEFIPNFENQVKFLELKIKSLEDEKFTILSDQKNFVKELNNKDFQISQLYRKLNELKMENLKIKEDLLSSQKKYKEEAKGKVLTEKIADSSDSKIGRLNLSKLKTPSKKIKEKNTISNNNSKDRQKNIDPKKMIPSQETEPEPDNQGFCEDTDKLFEQCRDHLKEGLQMIKTESMQKREIIVNEIRDLESTHRENLERAENDFLKKVFLIMSAFI